MALRPPSTTSSVPVTGWCLGRLSCLHQITRKYRAVNLAIEQNAWGAFETEFYPTYDFRPVWQGITARAAQTKGNT